MSEQNTNAEIEFPLHFERDSKLVVSKSGQIICRTYEPSSAIDLEADQLGEWLAAALNGIAALEAENRRLRDALGHYAHRSHWAGENRDLYVGGIEGTELAKHTLSEEGVQSLRFKV